MRKMMYPEANARFTMMCNYVRCFQDVTLKRQDKWNDFRMSYSPKYETFPASWIRVLLTDFKTITELKDEYMKHPHDDDEVQELEKIFGYHSYVRSDGGRSVFADGIIADFFKDPKNGFQIHTCHYCDMAYINVYTKKYAGKIQYKRHFDLDHVVGKKLCPVFGMSLFNFVPSCKECNQSIKHADELGGGDSLKLRKFSPSSNEYSIEKKVNVRVRMRKKCCARFLDNRDNFEIKMQCSPFYREYVNFFDLEERYDYHRDEALRLLDLKRKYTKSNIKQIANLLGIAPEEVHEDIFALKFSHNSHRCFEKLRRDILK